MRRAALRFSIAAWGLAAAGVIFAQTPPATTAPNAESGATPQAATSQSAISSSEQNVTGGKLHGLVKSGAVWQAARDVVLPGVE